MQLCAPVRDHVESHSQTRLNIDSILSPCAILRSVLARSASSVVAALMSPTTVSEKALERIDVSEDESAEIDLSVGGG